MPRKLFSETACYFDYFSVKTTLKWVSHGIILENMKNYCHV